MKCISPSALLCQWAKTAADFTKAPTNCSTTFASNRYAPIAAPSVLCACLAASSRCTRLLPHLAAVPLVPRPAGRPRAGVGAAPVAAHPAAEEHEVLALLLLLVVQGVQRGGAHAQLLELVAGEQHGDHHVLRRARLQGGRGGA